MGARDRIARALAEVIGQKTRGGTYYEVLKNPTKGDLLSVAKDYPTMGREAPQMRVMQQGADAYAWPAAYATHDDVSEALKLGKIPMDARDNLSVAGSKLVSGKPAGVDWNSLFYGVGATGAMGALYEPQLEQRQ